VPIYVAALGSAAVEQAAEIADGIMPTFWSLQRVARSKEWISHGRARAHDLGPLDVTLGLPTFIGDDLNDMRQAARQNLALYTGFPFFQRLWRNSGFEAEAAQMAAGRGAESLSDALLDACCLIGPVEHCQQRLAEYRATGIDLPILAPPIGPDAARIVIRAFASG